MFKFKRDANEVQKKRKTKSGTVADHFSIVVYWVCRRQLRTVYQYNR